MHGQTMSFSQKNKIANDFIKRVKPYDKQPGLKFDMRGYAKYLADNNIPGNKVPAHVVEMFRK